MTSEDDDCNTWEAAYRGYVRLRRQCGAMRGRSVLAKLITQFLVSAPPPLSYLEEWEAVAARLDRQGKAAQAGDLRAALVAFRTSVLKDAELLHKALDKIDTGRVASDAYEAALVIVKRNWLPYSSWNSVDGLALTPSDREPFRTNINWTRTDQNGWPAPVLETPSGEGVKAVFRGTRRSNFEARCRLDRPDACWDRDLARLGTLVVAMRKLFPGYADEYLVAVCQHYFEEAAVRTWLVDVTLDPFVALFFATFGATAGDTGRVTLFDIDELGRLGAGAGTTLGDVRLIHVPGIPRLRRQRGAFLEGAHPQALELVFPFHVDFRQRDGIVFEDPDRRLSKDALLSPDDFIVQFIAAWRSHPQAQPVKGAQLVPVVRQGSLSLSPRDLRDLLDHVPFSTQEGYERRSRLDRLCAFHAKLIREGLRSGSLRQLVRAARRMVSSVAEPDLDTLYLPLDPDDERLFYKLVEDT